MRQSEKIAIEVKRILHEQAVARGAKGAAKRNASMTAERRKEIAAKAARARWGAGE